MPEQQHPNEASRKSKAEGDRSAPETENTDTGQRSGYATDEQGAGITNRPLDEEIENQEAVPDRGTSKPGAHAGHGDDDTDQRRSER